VGRKKTSKKSKPATRAAPPPKEEPSLPAPAPPPPDRRIAALPPLRIALEIVLVVAVGCGVFFFGKIDPILPGWLFFLLLLAWVGMAVRIFVIFGLSDLIVPLGLALMVVVRPWLDGITYLTDNFYFVWALVILFGVWVVMALMRDERIRFGIPILLLGMFWVVSAITGLFTVQYDETYRALILWAGHFILFVLATNALRTRTAIGIVLAAFAAVSLVEAVYSIVHLKYVIPLVRAAVKSDLRLFVSHFGTVKPDAELIHRLQANRAFGSFLQPNTLAAFLVLGIPFALGSGLQSIKLLAQRLRATREDGPEETAQQQKQDALFRYVFVAGIATWFVVIVANYALFKFIGKFEFPIESEAVRSMVLPLVYSESGETHLDQAGYVFGWAVFVFFLPLLLGGAAMVVTRRYGIGVFWLSLEACFLPLLFLIQLVSLWLSFSRGGMIALFATALFIGGIFALDYFPGTGPLRRVVNGLAAVALIVLLIAGLGAGAQDSPSTAPTAAKPAVATEKQPETESPTMTQKLPAPKLPAAAKLITRDGKDMGVDDLAHPGSFRLRLGYWKSGLYMIKDNFLTGVGIGNFGVVYPKYQRPGAGPVKAMHNDFFQMFCETGIFGFLLFTGFWLYFFVWGALRLIRERDFLERLVLGGLYAGVLAFLVHSQVDFNFINPALAFFALLLAGVFYSRAAVNAPAPNKKARRSAIMLPLLVIASLVAGCAVPVFWSDFLLSGGKTFLSVGNRQELNVLYNAGTFLLKTRPLKERDKFRFKDLASVYKLIPSRSDIERIGSIRVSDENAPQGNRALRPDEPMPLETAFFMETGKPKEVRAVALKYIELWLEKLKRADAVFPHNPETASHLFQWYQTMTDRTPDLDLKRVYVREQVKWAREAVARSPENFLYHQWLGQALWSEGNLDNSPQRWGILEESVAEHKRSAMLWPNSAGVLQRYGNVLKAYGEALVKIDREEEGEKLIDEANQVLRRVNQLVRMNS